VKIILTVFLSILIVSAKGQNAPAKDTAVFYNSFSWSPDGTTLCFSVIVMPGGAFNAKHWETGSIIIQTKAVTRITNNTDDDDCRHMHQMARKLSLSQHAMAAPRYM